MSKAKISHDEEIAEIWFFSLPFRIFIKRTCFCTCTRLMNVLSCIQITRFFRIWNARNTNFPSQERNKYLKLDKKKVWKGWSTREKLMQLMKASRSMYTLAIFHYLARKDKRFYLTNPRGRSCVKHEPQRKKKGNISKKRRRKKSREKEKKSRDRRPPKQPSGAKREEHFFNSL